MKDLVTQSRALLDSRNQRGVSRELTRMRQSTELVVAEQTNRIDAIEAVSDAALMSVAHVSALEAHLVGMTPHAEGRLRHVADTSALAIANVVSKMARS